jgi:hypothetical protein
VSTATSWRRAFGEMPVAFAVCALFPLIALPLVPVEAAD